MTDLNHRDENHIGEMITRDDNTTEHLKSYRLSGKQTRRAWLLQQLDSTEWDLTAVAKNAACRDRNSFAESGTQDLVIC